MSAIKLLRSRPRPQHQPNNQQHAASAHQRKNSIGVGNPGHSPSLPPPGQIPLEEEAEHDAQHRCSALKADSNIRNSGVCSLRASTRSLPLWDSSFALNRLHIRPCSTHSRLLGDCAAPQTGPGPKLLGCPPVACSGLPQSEAFLRHASASGSPVAAPHLAPIPWLSALLLPHLSAGQKKIRSCCSNPPSVPSRWC